jgi:hypothetical protein
MLPPAQTGSGLSWHDRWLVATASIHSVRSLSFRCLGIRPEAHVVTPCTRRSAPCRRGH